MEFEAFGFKLFSMQINFFGIGRAILNKNGIVAGRDEKNSQGGNGGYTNQKSEMMGLTTVRDVMTTEVKVCSPQDSITAAARIMRDVNCGAVPVCEGEQIVGMITDRDIVIHCVAQGQDCNNVSCSECMTGHVVTCSPDMDVHECARLMAEHQIRRIPVEQDGQIVGICAIGDLATVNIFANEAGDALSQISERLH